MVSHLITSRCRIRRRLDRILEHCTIEMDIFAMPHRFSMVNAREMLSGEKVYLGGGATFQGGLPQGMTGG